MNVKNQLYQRGPDTSQIGRNESLTRFYASLSLMIFGARVLSSLVLVLIPQDVAESLDQFIDLPGTI